MKFSTLLDKHVKIRFVTGVSKFIVNNKFFIIKCNNRLFKIDSSSKDKRRMLQILEHPKKLGEILELLPKYDKKDVIKFLDRLHDLNLIELENTIPQQEATSRIISSKVDIVKNYVNHHLRQSSSLRILVIGKGILANNLFAHLRNAGLNCIKIGSSTLVGKTSQKKK